MGCYLEDYCARVGTWAGKFSLRGVACLGVVTLTELLVTAWD